MRASGDTIGWRAVGGREDAAGELAVEHVAMHLDVFLRRADVDPVAAIDVGDERLLALDQRREVGALDRIGTSFGMRSNVSGSST